MNLCVRKWFLCHVQTGKHDIFKPDFAADWHELSMGRGHETVSSWVRTPNVGERSRSHKTRDRFGLERVIFAGMEFRSSPIPRYGRERFAICGGGARVVRIRRLSIRTMNVNSA